MLRILTTAVFLSVPAVLVGESCVSALEPLPLGSITARGWLREQLMRNRDGMGGHLDELEPQMIATPYTTRETYKGWGACTPGWGAEISGNYWSGLIQLAWTLDDAGLKAKAAKWVGEVLQNVETNGYFGTYPPGSNRMEDYNASGNACGYLALLGFYEATGRKDVLDAVHNALLWFCREWAGDRKTRYSGATLSVPMLECARLTGDRRLVEFCLDYQRFLEAKDLFRTSARSFASDDFEYNSNHAVSYVNHMAIPAMLYSATSERTYLDASLAAVDKLRRQAYHVTGAPSGNDEYLSAPRVNGESEYCGFAGVVDGYSRILSASGDTRFGDWMEETAFNAVQGARKKDEKAIQYFSSPNMVYATVKSSHTQMDDNLFGPVHPVACCAVRAVQVLPGFVRSLAMRDKAGNLHLTAYAPCAICHRGVELVSETVYPFRDTVAYDIRSEHPVRFAIIPKRPYWCPKMTLRVNGKEVASADRVWRTGDRLELKFEMPVRVERFKDRAGTEPLVIRRGPLVFSLPIGENWKNLGNGVTGGGTHNCAAATPLPEGWAWWSVEPVIDRKPVPMYEEQGYVREMISWNVALDETRMDIKIEEAELKGYVWENPPVRLHLTGYKAPFAFPPYPAKTTEYYQPLQTVTRPLPVTLVPFGCTALRITYFPRCDAKKLRPDLSFECVPAAEKIRVACIGDSITYGYAMTNRTHESYPVQLQELLGDRYEVRNFGDPGAGVYTHLKAFTGNGPRCWALRGQLEQALAFRPDIVISNLGINDAQEYGKELASDLARGTFVREYVEILNKFKMNDRKVKIVLWTRLAPCAKTHTLKGSPLPFAMSKDLESVARSVGGRGLDMYTPLLPLSETAHYCADGVHPEGGACKVIAAETAKCIKDR